MVKNNKIIEVIIIGTFVILAIIGIIQLTLKITGHSPTEFQILSSLLIIIVGFILGVGYKFGIFIGKTNNFMKNTTRQFSEIKLELKEMKNDTKENKENINKIFLELEKLKTMEKDISKILTKLN
jgi:hypothetical protein